MNKHIENIEFEHLFNSPIVVSHKKIVEHDFKVVRLPLVNSWLEMK